MFDGDLKRKTKGSLADIRTHRQKMGERFDCDRCGFTYGEYEMVMNDGARVQKTDHGCYDLDSEDARP